MKKPIAIAIVCLAAIAIIINATQKIVNTLTGLGKHIPSELATGMVYDNFLKNEIDRIDKYDLNQLRASVKRDYEIRQEYLATFKAIMAELKSVGQTNNG